MTQFSLGDLAGNFLLRRHNTALQQKMGVLTNEVATGRVQDTVSHLSARLSSLSALERDLDMVNALRISVSEAQVQATTTQAALGTVQDRTAEFGDAITIASAAPASVVRASVTTAARQTLDGVVSALNSQVAGRSLFAGADVSTKPLEDTEVLLDALRNAVAGAVTSQDILAAADTFFDTPGGDFDTLVYRGGPLDLAPVALGDGQTVGFDIRADNPVLKATIKTVAIASLFEELASSLPPQEAVGLLDTLAGRALGDQDRLTGLRGDLGFAEQRIEIRSAELGARRSSVELARNELISADPYQSATELEAVQQQIEILYSLTARSSRLSLVNFLS